MILGLTGSYCSGKDTVADYLVTKKGFLHFSLSDELRKELTNRNIELTRENLIKYGTQLRETKGNTVLAEMVLQHIPDNKNSIVTSIRHTSEIEKLNTNKNFLLVNIDAPIKVRFERMKNRNRPGDPDTFEKFIELEKKESQTEGSGQQLKKCSEMASLNFINDTKSLEDLHKKIDSFLKGLK